MKDPYARQKAYYRRKHPMSAIPPPERPCVTCGQPHGRPSPITRFCDSCRVSRERAKVRAYEVRNPAKVKVWSRRARVKRRQRPEVVEQDRERGRQWRAKDPYEKRMRSRYWRHGVTPEEFDALLERQSGACALCLTPFPATREERYERREPQVDHDHKTNQVRGLLCRICNTRLGAVEKLTPEWFERLKDYIAAGKTSPAVLEAVEEMLG